jgi:hypothetical protein
MIRRKLSMPRDIDTFLGVITKHMSRDHLHEILEAITTELGEYGSCPLCGCEDIPVDRDGNEIESDDVSEAYEWREVHEDDCPVTIIEKSKRYTL